MTGLVTLHSIDNSSMGITNAGRISGVAAGTAPTDAVNISQMIDFSLAVEDAFDGIATDASAAQAMADTALANAATAQAGADTATANAAAAQAAADTALALGQNSLQYDPPASPSTPGSAAGAESARSAPAPAERTSLTLNPGGAAAGLHNLAAGIAPNDAVNLSQLEAVSSAVTALGGRTAALEGQLAAFSASLRRVDKLASRGVAIATALASIPPLAGSQRFGLGVGVGGYDGQAAFSAAFLGRLTDRMQVRLNAGTSGSGKVAGGGGVTVGW